MMNGLADAMERIVRKIVIGDVFIVEIMNFMTSVLLCMIILWIVMEESLCLY